MNFITIFEVYVIIRSELLFFGKIYKVVIHYIYCILLTQSVCSTPNETLRETSESLFLAPFDPKSVVLGSVLGYVSSEKRRTKYVFFLRWQVELAISNLKVR